MRCISFFVSMGQADQTPEEIIEVEMVALTALGDPPPKALPLFF